MFYIESGLENAVNPLFVRHHADRFGATGRQSRWRDLLADRLRRHQIAFQFVAFISRK